MLGVPALLFGQESPAPLQAEADQICEIHWPARIAHVSVVGNKITKSRVIIGYCGLDSGMVADSADIVDAERSLITSSLFRKVKILTVAKPEGIDLYIDVVEYPVYFSFPPQLDLYHYYYRHDVRGDWYCPVASIDLTNFGGRMESIDLAAQVGEWGSYSLFWQKPLVPSRFFIGLGGNYSCTPDNYYDLNQTKLSGTLLVGRRFFGRSSASVTLTPTVRTIDSAGTHSRNSQMYSSVGWASDFRSSTFDPSNGALLSFSVTTNALHPEPDVNRYLQFSTNIKFYHPFILFRGDRFAYRFSTLIRNSDAGVLNRVVTGGTGSVRGYYTDEIGQYTSSGVLISENNALLFSWEYRFPIYQIPALADLLPDQYAQMLGGFNTIAPRLDGALILNYGRVSPTPSELFRRSENSSCGTGIGFGLRFVEPTLRYNACLDFIWSTDPNPETSGMRFEARRLINLYAGMNF